MGEDEDRGDKAGRDIYNVENLSGSGNAFGPGASVYHERELTQGEAAARDEEVGLEKLEGALSDYVENLVQKVSKTQEHLHPQNPYKPLLEYEIEDTNFFYGRSDIAQEFLKKISNQKFTILFAESGAGKSSFLKAAIMPELINNGQIPLYVGVITNPLHQKIKRSLWGNVEQSTTFANANLLYFLQRSSNLLRKLGRNRLYILIDQFEEFFTQQATDIRRGFLVELNDCLDDLNLNVSWVFSLRKEFLGDMGLDSPFSHFIQNQFPLPLLNRMQAQEAVVKPARLKGVSFEDKLLERMMNDLGEDNIYPPELQLVCYELFNTPRSDHTLITDELYSQRGGASKILEDHLENVINKFPGKQRILARSALSTLFTSEKKKISRSKGAIVGKLKSLNLDISHLDEVLERLQSNYLIRIVDGNDMDQEAEEVYELAHDYLADKIKDPPAIAQAKLASELIDNKIPLFKHDKILLSEEELNFITPVSDSLSLSSDAMKLLTASQAKINRKETNNFFWPIWVILGLLGSIPILYALIPKTQSIIVTIFWVLVISFGLVSAGHIHNGILTTFGTLFGLLILQILTNHLSLFRYTPKTLIPFFQLLIVCIPIYFSNQIFNIFPLRFKSSRRLQVSLFSSILGLLNGYLIIGSILFFLLDTNTIPLFSSASGNTVGNDFQRLIHYLPPIWLTIPYNIFLVIIVGFLVVFWFADIPIGNKASSSMQDF